MANEQQKSSLTPIIIIGGIFLATILGIYFIMNSGNEEIVDQEPTNTTPTEQGNSAATPSTDGKVPNYDSAPGAVPANAKGKEDSTVVIEEFADFQCPTCAVVHPKMVELMKKYGDRVKFIFRNYPLSQVHPNAYAAASAAEAAGAQNKFWEMQDLIFVNQGNWSTMPNPRTEFEKYAQQLGLNVEKFKNDSAAMNIKSRVDADINRGRALNVQSTPSVFLNGRLIPHNQVEVQTLGQLIDAELAKSNDKPKTDEASADKEEKPAEKSENSNK